MKLADVDFLAGDGPLGSSRITRPTYGVHSTVQKARTPIPDHTPNSDPSSLICTEYIHLYYLIHGFFSSLSPLSSNDFPAHW